MQQGPNAPQNPESPISRPRARTTQTNQTKDTSFIKSPSFMRRRAETTIHPDKDNNENRPTENGSNESNPKQKSKVKAKSRSFRVRAKFKPDPYSSSPPPLVGSSEPLSPPKVRRNLNSLVPNEAAYLEGLTGQTTAEKGWVSVDVHTIPAGKKKTPAIALPPSILSKTPRVSPPSSPPTSPKLPNIQALSLSESPNIPSPVLQRVVTFEKLALAQKPQTPSLPKFKKDDKEQSEQIKQLITFFTEFVSSGHDESEVPDHIEGIKLGKPELLEAFRLTRELQQQEVAEQLASQMKEETGDLLKSQGKEQGAENLTNRLRRFFKKKMN